MTTTTTTTTQTLTTGKKLPLERWQKNRDAVSGQDAIKAGGVKYLPDDQEHDGSNEARTRYKNYLKRALFVLIAKATVNRLSGATFRRPFETSLKDIDQLAYLMEDVDGAGQGLEQLAKKATKEDLVVGRIGFLADYPETPDGLTRESSEEYRAFIAPYLAESILDWRKSKIKGKWQTSYIKLSETDENGETCYRELMLDEEDLYVQKFTDAKNNETFYEPRDADGQRFKFIPFSICGAEENTFDLQESPIDGIVDINITHYQMTADKNKNLHIHCGGLLHIGTDADQASFGAANPNGVTVGADSAIVTEAAGKVEIVQLQASSQIQAEIESLQEQAIMLGAGLVQKGGANQTAEAARLNASASTSTLETIVGNVSEAIEQALEYCAMFMGVDPAEVTFSLNNSFFDEKPESQLMTILSAYEDKGIVSRANIRSYLRRTGIIPADTTDEMIDEQIVEWRAQQAEDEAKKNQDQDQSNGSNGGSGEEGEGGRDGD